ncbi:MAG: ABC transporter ATP-binding protein [Actinomycetota bacterium]|nr:ABC transporter ATP-binding protein [Actinomycetota bacterium]
MAQIVIRDLLRTYPGAKHPATDHIDLTVGDGEFMVLLGPSGCGKTTLLRQIAGLDLPDAGAISIGGRDVTYLPPRERHLAMVFQSYAVFPHLKVSDNIGFGLAMRKESKTKIGERVAWAASLLQLEPYLDRYPAKLSGGQRQRVAVARAIVMEPEVLLMDEPLSNLDALLRLSFRAELKKLVQDLGTTCVYVTHDQVEALSLGDRVAVMSTGRIAQVGPPLDIYDRPADAFVGGFIGSPPMNFLTGRLTGGDGQGRQVEIEGQRLPAPAAHVGAAGDRGVLLGVRAENLTTSLEPRSDALQVDVVVNEPLGSHNLVTARLGEQVLKVQTASDFPVPAHGKLWITAPPERLVWFDAQTREALAPDRPDAPGAGPA